MKYLHTMIRVSDPEETLRFFSLLGLKEVRRMDNEAGRFTLIFLAAPGDEDAQIELTHNWDAEEGYGEGRNFGHVAYRGGRCLRDLPAADGRGRHDQPAAARGPDGFRPHPRRDLDRAAAEGRQPARRRALGVDAEYGPLVSGWPDRRFADLLGSRLPILAAPMAGAAGVELAVAAIEGGAVGSLPCAMLTAEEARAQVAAVRAR